MFTLNYLKPIDSTTATKTFTHKKGKWELTDAYTGGKLFNGYEVGVNSLRDIYESLVVSLDFPAFLIAGGFIEGTTLQGMVRRKRENKDGNSPTIEDRELCYLPVDVDGWEIPDGMAAEQAVDYFIRSELPQEFQHTDYVYQLSSSFGLLSGTTLKAHIFFWLKRPVHNLQMQAWAKDFNESKEWGNIVDPAIYTCSQPLYTQRRICHGSTDPVENPLAYIKKDAQVLDWHPDSCSSRNAPGSPPGDNKPMERKTTSPSGFKIAEATRAIVTGENFHENVRGLALSMMNAGTPSRKVIQHIEGIMQACEVQDERWKERYDDIGRMVDTAKDIVDIPTFDELAGWIEESDSKTVMAGFARRTLHLDPVELKLIITILDDKLGVGPRAITATIKMAQEEADKEKEEYARRKKSEERSSMGVTEIEINNDNHGVATQMVAQLLADSEKYPQVFKMGNSLSIVAKGQPKTVRQMISRQDQGLDFPEMPIIQDITKPLGVLRGRIEQDCIFVNSTGKDIICPDSILGAAQKMYGVKWRPLTGIVEHPFIDDNWNIIQKQGYDARTGLFTVLHHKLKITIMDPKEAYNYLAYEVFDEFPFNSDLDRAVAVGALMTAVQRPYVTGDGGFPGFAIISPKQSSGKTTMAQLINYAIYNRPVAVTSWSDNDEELGKHLLAILREGHSCVLFDNISQGTSIKSDELARAMTTGTYSRRKLGENETEEVPASVMWIFTGNNIKFVGDFATRVLPIKIVPDMERPESRKFSRENIGQWALDNRKKIISAVLSIVLEGKDLKREDYADETRFKMWERFVRKPLAHVSGFDLLDVFSENRLEDDDTVARGHLLVVLKEEFGNGKFKTREIFKACNGSLEAGAFNSDGSEMKMAVIDSFGEKAATNIKTLGRYLSGLENNIIGGYKLVRTDKSQGVNWMILEMEV